MLETESPRFAILGDHALIIYIGEQVDTTTFRAVRSLARKLELLPPKGMIEFVPAFTTITVYYDPLCISERELTTNIIKLASMADESIVSTPRTVEIPVCYGGEYGADLDFVARQANLTQPEVIEIHAAAEYLVHMIGFAPGFPYLGGMSPRIAAPRRNSPRLRVPAGSVGIAGDQTGIYPMETPGGWQLIGRTPLVLFRPQQDPPTLLQIGDIVRFRLITPKQFRKLSESHE